MPEIHMFNFVNGSTLKRAIVVCHPRSCDIQYYGVDGFLKVEAKQCVYHNASIVIISL